jgi:DNA helicase-2/ATP-dependent DNA helicase PcrA
LREHWEDQLNPEQRMAVEHRGPPLLVIAGAGTGKTLTLAARVAHLVEEGVPPERILLLTFSRRAAREMLSRAGRLAGRDVSGKVWGGTFHAAANRLLRMFGRPLGLSPDFTVMDQADAADLMSLIRTDLGLGRGERRFPKKDTLAAIYSRAVNANERLAPILDRSFPWCREEIDGIRSVFVRYGERKRATNVLDFDDLLLFWRALLQAPGAGARAAALFDHVLVDEFQDTNAVQAEILLLMRAPAGTGLMVVGDDAQAIYSFRAATVRNILDFPDAFPEARVIRLEQNYRSTEPVLRVSNAAIALSTERHEKTLWTRRPGAGRPLLVTCLDEADQCDAVCRSVLEHRERGVALRDQAVLFRAAHHSDQLEVELARRNIPFVKYGGLKFLEAAHVKDVLALLRILENPRDEVSWFRVLQLLEGVGPATARRAIDALLQDDPAARSPLARLVEDPPQVPGLAGEGLTALRRAIVECTAGGTEGSALPVAVQVARLRAFLEPVVLRMYSSPASRLHDLEQVEGMASGSPSRGRFLADLTLDPPASTGDLAGPPLLDDDYLILTTIHSAKGCEWTAVHLIHAADGMMPSDMATGSVEEIEEERRLLYVAMTRARDALEVYFPLRYYRRPRGLGDAHSYAQLTRFLPPSLKELFDCRSTELAGGRAGEDRVDGTAPASVPAVDALLATLWSE